MPQHVFGQTIILEKVKRHDFDDYFTTAQKLASMPISCTLPFAITPSVATAEPSLPNSGDVRSYSSVASQSTPKAPMTISPLLESLASVSCGSSKEDKRIIKQDAKIRALERERDQMSLEIKQLKQDFERFKKQTRETSVGDVLTSIEKETQVLKQNIDEHKQRYTALSTSIDETKTNLESLRDHTTQGLSSLTNDVAHCLEQITMVKSTQRQIPDNILQMTKLVQFLNVQLEKTFKRIGHDIHIVKTKTENMILSHNTLAATICETNNKNAHTSRQLKLAHNQLIENIKARNQNDKKIQTNFDHRLAESKKTFDNLSRTIEEMQQEQRSQENNSESTHLNEHHDKTTNKLSTQPDLQPPGVEQQRHTQSAPIKQTKNTRRQQIRAR